MPGESKLTITPWLLEVRNHVSVLNCGALLYESEYGDRKYCVEPRNPGCTRRDRVVSCPQGSVNSGQDGIEVQVLNPDEAFSATPKVSEEPGVAILQVADLQSGALPKSGGMGVVPFAIVALLILGLGAFMLRRRM